MNSVRDLVTEPFGVERVRNRAVIKLLQSPDNHGDILGSEYSLSSAITTPPSTAAGSDIITLPADPPEERYDVHG